MANYQSARIEELSDSDSDVNSDPSDMDPSDFAPIRPTTVAKANPSTMQASEVPFRSAPQQPLAAPKIQTKTWSTLYPVYFDSSRSRAEGRRVSKNLATPNPLATEVADACTSLGLRAKLEVMSTHPKDWANVGRVKVQMKETDSGQRMTGSAGVQNKHHLYILVAKYLQSHPTSAKTPLRLPNVPGEKAEPKPKPNVPRGWKLNDILPMHSPAVTGNGVTDNPLKDAMAQLGQAGGSMPGMPMGLDAGPSASDAGESKKKKKDKKKG